MSNPTQPPAPTRNAGTSPSSAEELFPNNETLVRHIRGAGAWLLAFAIFSAINTLLPLFGLPIQLAMGLTLTDGLLALALSYGPLPGYLAVAVNAGIVAVVAVLGLRARRLQPWAPKLCLVVTALDLCILVGLMIYSQELTLVRPILDLVGFGFIWLGVKAARVLAERRTQGLA